MNGDKRRARARQKARESRGGGFEPRLVPLPEVEGATRHLVPPGGDVGRCPECGAAGVSFLTRSEFSEHAALAGVRLRARVEDVPVPTWWWCHACDNGGPLGTVGG